MPDKRISKLEVLGLRRRICAWGVRQSALQRVNQVLNCNMPPQFAAIWVGVLIDPDMEAQPIEHLNDLSYLSFGQ